MNGVRAGFARRCLTAAAALWVLGASLSATAGPPPLPAPVPASPPGAPSGGIGAWVNGTVVDDAGKPYCGAQVRVVEEKPTAAKEKAAGAWTATTDARGFFAVHGVPAGDAVVVVSARGRVTSRRRVTVPQSGTVSTEAKLVPGVRFAGTVTDADGKPVGGVTLLAFEGVREKPSRFGFVIGSTKAGGSGTSKDDGTFEVDGLAAGTEYRLRAEHPHYVVLDVPGLDAAAGGGHDALDLVLEPAAWVSGVVVDASGGAVAGARVMRPEDEASEEDEFIRRFLRMVVPRDTTDASVSDARGRFVVGSLKAGSVRLTATAEGYFDGTVTADAAVGKETGGLKVVLEIATAWVEGEAADEAGKPLAGVSVSASSDEGDCGTATSDATGKWRIAHVRSRGPVDLAAKLDGHVPVEKKHVPLDSRGLKLVLSRAGRLKVKVLDAKGVVLDRVAIRVVVQTADGKPSSSWRFSNQTAEGAEVEIPVGEVEVYAEADGYDESTVGTFQSAPGKTVDGGTVKLKPSDD